MLMFRRSVTTRTKRPQNETTVRTRRAKPTDNKRHQDPRNVKLKWWSLIIHFGCAPSPSFVLAVQLSYPGWCCLVLLSCLLLLVGGGAFSLFPFGWCCLASFFWWCCRSPLFSFLVDFCLVRVMFSKYKMFNHRWKRKKGESSTTQKEVEKAAAPRKTPLPFLFPLFCFYFHFLMPPVVVAPRHRLQSRICTSRNIVSYWENVCCLFSISCVFPKKQNLAKLKTQVRPYHRPPLPFPSSTYHRPLSLLSQKSIRSDFSYYFKS